MGGWVYQYLPDYSSWHDDGSFLFALDVLVQPPYAFLDIGKWHDMYNLGGWFTCTIRISIKTRDVERQYNIEWHGFHNSVILPRVAKLDHSR